jgi:transitional endoplasmic reticulum ATPase
MAGPDVSSAVTRYRRDAARITSRSVLCESEKLEQIRALPRRHRKKTGSGFESSWTSVEDEAAREAAALLELLRTPTTALHDGLGRLAELRVPELLGKVESEQLRVRTVLGDIEQASAAVDRRDFGSAGAHLEAAERGLSQTGGPFVVAVNAAIGQAAVGRELRGLIEANVIEQEAADLEAAALASSSPALDRIGALVAVLTARIRGYETAADILHAQVERPSSTVRRGAAREQGGLTVVLPQDCETFSEVGGLDAAKATLRSTVGAILERPDQAARYQVVHNGILFHGPPGTGKTLLSRALAGEYGLRYIRFSPASIASAYIHEAAANLQRLFELARQNAPCVLFLDEIDTIASNRSDQPSADHREVVTQLMNSLEEFRRVPGLVICAATNDIDRLDPGLREGRFDTKILLPLPDSEARQSILTVLLERRDEAVDWAAIDIDAIARLTSGYNAAAVEGIVSRAAQAALADDVRISHSQLVGAVEEREGKDRLNLDEKLTWDDVVLADPTRSEIFEILSVFSRPQLARELGVKPPAGILLYGPPGTGKTTIAKVMASEVSASFYELSAAELLSKWAGESEQKVAKLFAKARSGRPAIVFIDEIDGLLRRRSSDSSAAWEERVVSQFLRELDGLRAGEGVLLVGATNRLDIIDEAIVSRRLTPIRVGMPDLEGRMRLLELLCKNLKLAKDVKLRRIATRTDGMSGADLRRVRDVAGMKALARVSGSSTTPTDIAITMLDFEQALDNQFDQASLAQV